MVKAGLIASAYIVLTIVFAPLSYAVMQVRISEALVSLAVFTPAAIPGLTVGCFISGILGPSGIADAVIGSLATLLGALGTYALRRHRYIAPLMNVISNAVIIGIMLCKIYNVGLSLIVCIAWVGLGEAVSCIGIGSVVTKYISSLKNNIANHKQ